MKNFSFMLYVFLFDNSGYKSSVGKQNKGYYNCYGNNYKDQQIDI
ncbi:MULTISPECIES: hypothetical protein [Chryseobacterium]|jgi:hypothetical protein|nr:MULTISPECIES: hypothetical protein [Chryseobacterium]MDR6463139.1 hypothetical protein [Chryseobacterium sediminis]